MRKLLSLLMVGMLALGLVGCKHARTHYHDQGHAAAMLDDHAATDMNMHVENHVGSTQTIGAVIDGQHVQKAIGM